MITRDQLGQFLGERLLQLRHERGWTLAECAAAANIAKSHLSQIEQGLRIPSLGKLIDLADQLGVKVCDLFIHEGYGFDVEVYDDLRRKRQRERFPY